MDEKEIAVRLAKLRIAKGVSARDMSLSIGQNPGYINNIETGKTLPSLAGLFYICEYLGITPSEFFDENITEPMKLRTLINSAKGLNGQQLDTLIAVANGFKK